MDNTTEGTSTTTATDHRTGRMTTGTRAVNGSDTRPVIVGSGDNNNKGDVDAHGPVPKSQLPTAAVLGGIVALIVICIVVVLVYRKNSQRKYKQRTRRSEEEVGFMDADVDNRRSDIAMQLLQVNDPSFFEIEEATQNAKLQELQGQNDLNLMEIINGTGVKTDKVKDEKQGQSEGQKSAKAGSKVKNNKEAKSSKSSIPGSLIDEKKHANSSDISVPGSPGKEKKTELPSSGNASSSKNDKAGGSSQISATEAESDSQRKAKRATSLQLSNVRISHAEKYKQRQSEIVGNYNLKSEAKFDTQEQNSSMESRVEQRLKQRQSARSSGGSHSDKRTSEKLNHSKATHPPIGGGVAPEVAQTASARSSKHSSGGYDEALKQLKHVDSDPNLTEGHGTK
ncbi:uncharacterized protein LOC134267250 [Saccostrea cucullata]|uniref:uncharacterized protein LOC134267250 n=1 Tax=Saccostrea cuccullata TaxID=36930 RepID=UPI002ECFB5B5